MWWNWKTISEGVTQRRNVLQDNFSRKFSYLRLSITDVCNFKCTYCLPNGYEKSSSEKFINLEEIKNLALAFKELGIKKVRLTGGEPTLRRDIIDIINLLKNEIGFEAVALTTNAYRLKSLLNDLKKNGLDAINISLDSLNEKRFKEITGSNKGREVIESVDEALALGFKSVKINTVFLKGITDLELDKFLCFIQGRDVTLRFIELMRTGSNKDYFDKYHGDFYYLSKMLIRDGWRPITQGLVSGPAKEFFHERFQGRLGYIAPYSKDFCNSCNRLRVSSRGALRLCLFGNDDLSLRHYLQSGQDRYRLKELIKTSLGFKEKGHQLHTGNFGITHSLSGIGG